MPVGVAVLAGEAVRVGVVVVGLRVARGVGVAVGVVAGAGVFRMGIGKGPGRRGIGAVAHGGLRGGGGAGPPVGGEAGPVVLR